MIGKLQHNLAVSIAKRLELSRTAHPTEKTPSGESVFCNHRALRPCVSRFAGYSTAAAEFTLFWDQLKSFAEGHKDDRARRESEGSEMVQKGSEMMQVFNLMSGSEGPKNRIRMAFLTEMQQMTAGAVGMQGGELTAYQMRELRTLQSCVFCTCVWRHNIDWCLQVAQDQCAGYCG